MSETSLSFLDEAEDEVELVEQIAPQEETIPEPEPEGEPVAVPPAAQEEVRAIPLTALLDEREKRQKAERDLAELQRWKAEQEVAARPKPDFFENPEAAISQAQRAAMDAVYQTKLDTSRFLAVEKFGEDKVAAAYAFFDRNPHLSQPLANHPSPFHEAVRIYEKHRMIEEMGDDPQAWLDGKLRAQTAAPIPAAVAPPPSLSSAQASPGVKAPAVSGFAQTFGE